MASNPSTLIAIGGSAGAYDLVVEILENLPATFSAAIVVVLHRNSKYETKIESSLSKRFERRVLSIRDKTPILPNHIYFAPPGYHTLVEPGLRFALDVSEPVQFSRPSIDVFFESAAAVFQENCTAFLLSGANKDGATGFRSLIRHGAACYVQAPEEALMDSMPRAGLEASSQVAAWTQKEIINFFRTRISTGKHESN